MSFGELGIVIVIAIIFLKPEDIPAIIKFLQQSRELLQNFKAQCYKELSAFNSEETSQTIKDINYYLVKIVESQGKYEGEYNLAAVRKYYYQFIQPETSKDHDDIS